MPLSEQLRSLNANESTEMSQVSCQQLLKQDLKVYFIPLVILCMLTVRSVIFYICVIAAVVSK